MLFARFWFCSGSAYAPFNAGNKNFEVIQNPGFLPDQPQNLITCSLCHVRHTLKISERFVHNILSYLVHTQRQTKNGKNITSLAEVIIDRIDLVFD